MPSCLRPRFDAEDFVNDAILQVLQKPAPFIAADCAPAYLMRVARCRMIDQTRVTFTQKRGRGAKCCPPDQLPDRRATPAQEYDAVELWEWMEHRIGHK